MSKVNKMSYLQELQTQHRLFAEEAFIFLKNYPEVSDNFFQRCQFFRPYIGHAVVTISYMLRKEYGRLFRRLRGNLKHVKMFQKYCMAVPVKKDRRYFYYILMRVSLIFDLSLYCFCEGYNYFASGWKCLADYKDLEYFKSAGGWTKLGHTALFVASLGQPLTLLLAQKLDKGKRVRTFAEATHAVEWSFIISGKLSMLDGAEMYCLRKLSKLFRIQTRTRNTLVSEEQKRPEKKNGSSQHQNPEVSSSDTNSSASIIITEYFKKSWHVLISSVTLGYSVKALQHDYVLQLTTLNVKSSGEKHAEFNFNVDFSDKKVAYIVNYRSSYPWAETELSSDFLAIEVYTPITSTENKPVLDEIRYDSNVHRRENGAGILGRNPLSPNRNASKFIDSVPAEIQKENKPETYQPITIIAHRSTNSCKVGENLASERESTLHTTFVVPKSYLRLKEAGGTSKCLHMYSIKMCPPSRRQELSEPMKALLDENIENQNYDKMPSGDLLVCPLADSLNKDILIILAESSADVVDEFIDMAICQFKKLEIDSIEQSYSLRPRQPTSSGKENSKCDLDKAESKSEDMTSDEEPVWNTFRSVKRQKSRSAGNENLCAKTFISLYRKNITTFLDEYFKTDFTPASRPYKKPKINTDCVFVATASIMARRKVLLDEPDEMKRLIGIPLYQIHFQPMILPLDVQKALDYHVRNRNFFAAPNGVYGAGPKGPTERSNIWVIFFTGNGRSKGVEYSNEDVNEVSKMFHSYEPALEIFRPSIQLDLQNFRTFIDDLVGQGFLLHPDYRN